MLQKHIGMLYMLQVFQRYVTRVCSKMFHLFSDVHCKCFLSGCCICYNDYVASVCSKCLIYFSRMLQLLYLSVAKVDLDIGWSSEKERASAGAMVAAAVCWQQRSIGGRGAGVRTSVCGPGVGPHCAALIRSTACSPTPSLSRGSHHGVVTRAR
jgi:hypothetical protein